MKFAQLDFALLSFCCLNTDPKLAVVCFSLKFEVILHQPGPVSARLFCWNGFTKSFGPRRRNILHFPCLCNPFLRAPCIRRPNYFWCHPIKYSSPNYEIWIFSFKVLIGDFTRIDWTSLPTSIHRASGCRWADVFQFTQETLMILDGIEKIILKFKLESFKLNHSSWMHS